MKIIKTLLLGWLIGVVAVAVAVIADFVFYQLTGRQDLIPCVAAITLGIASYLLADYYLRD